MQFGIPPDLALLNRHLIESHKKGNAPIIALPFKNDSENTLGTKGIPDDKAEPLFLEYQESILFLSGAVKKYKTVGVLPFHLFTELRVFSGDVNYYTWGYNGNPSANKREVLIEEPELHIQQYDWAEAQEILFSLTNYTELVRKLLEWKSAPLIPIDFDVQMKLNALRQNAKV